MENVQPAGKKQLLMSSKPNYVITLKKPDFRLFNFISQLMLFLSIIAFLYDGIQTQSPFSMTYFVLCLVLISSWIYTTAIKKNNSFGLALAIAAAGWLFEPGYFKLLAVLFLVAAILEKKVKLAQEIHVDEEGVSLNHFILKKNNWKELANVILKDGLITIDYKDNRLFQKETESAVSPEQEKEFNEFCNSRLLARLK